MTDSGEIAVAIVEDDPEIRRTLALIIDGTPGYSCRSQWEDAETAIASLPKAGPDVVLMDINLPGMNGVEAVTRFRTQLPETDFIMLTVLEDDDSVFDSLCAGATGYLLKSTPPAAILRAIKEVRSGGSPMSRVIARKVAASFHRSDRSLLSSRETEILRLLCDGHSYSDVADQLFVSGHTVRTHIKNIYEKLQVHSRGEVVQKAIRDRLV